MYISLPLFLLSMALTSHKNHPILTTHAETAQKRVLYFRYFPQRSARFLDPTSECKFARVHIGMQTAKVTDEDTRLTAVSGDGRFVYSCYGYSSRVSQGYITQGVLHPLSPSTITAHSHPMSISLHPNGRFAYISCSHGAICQYRIDHSGHLLSLSPAEVYGSNDPSPLRFDPSGQFACVVADGSDDASQIVFVYRVQADGRLTLIRRIPSDYIENGTDSIMVQGEKVSIGK